MAERTIKWVATPPPSEKRKIPEKIPDIAEVVLKGLADNAYIEKHLASIGSLETTPLTELITVHNKLADFNDSIEKLSDKSTGAELKSALSKHDFETQIELLAGYIKHKKAEIAKVEKMWGAKDRRIQEQEFDFPDRRQRSEPPTPEISNELNSLENINGKEMLKLKIFFFKLVLFTIMTGITFYASMLLILDFKDSTLVLTYINKFLN